MKRHMKSYVIFKLCLHSDYTLYVFILLRGETGEIKRRIFDFNRIALYIKQLFTIMSVQLCLARGREATRRGLSISYRCTRVTSPIIYYFYGIYHN